MDTVRNEDFRGLPSIRIEEGDLQVEMDFELQCEGEVAPSRLEAQSHIVRKCIDAVDVRLAASDARLADLNKEIDRLTSHADGIDLMVAVASGVLAGLLDSLWVGAFDLEANKGLSNHEVNDFVMKMAKSNGYDGDRLDGAIRNLEGGFKIPSDNVWKDKGLGISARSHHLDDLAHHPTPVGLVVSILTQFTEKAYFQNSEGSSFSIDIDDETGALIGGDLGSKIFAGTINWFMHLASDMSGSNKSAGVGMGIPGPVVSILKELSLLPGLKDSGLPQKLKEVFVQERFDLRSELAVWDHLKRQALPVVLNEVLVRAFYFVRKLLTQLKEKGSWSEVDWRVTLPWKNRTVIRMLTVAHGTFTAIDLADAAIRGAIKSGGNGALFAREFLLRVNFVGVGRFAVAVFCDARMGAQRSSLRNEKIRVNGERLHFLNAKICYLHAGNWIAAESTYQTICEAEAQMKSTAILFLESLHERLDALNRIDGYRDGLVKHNPGLIHEINGLLRFEEK